MEGGITVMGRPHHWLLVAAIAVAASCGGSDDPSSGGTATTDTTVTTDGAPATVVEPDPTEQSVPPPDPSTVEIETPAAELSDLEGLDVITVTTPPVGNGEHPVLSWNPVAGAARYSLTLSEPGAAAYFAWTGTTESMTLGGSVEERVADAAGPILLTELVLRVVAFDETGAIIAASAPTPIAP